MKVTSCIIKKRKFGIRATEDACLVSSDNTYSSFPRVCSLRLFKKGRALVWDKKSSMDLSGQLGYYLAGILEGDGTIIVPKSDNANKNVPSIYISFHINDLEFAKKLISVLGYGTIQKEPTSKAFRLVIRNRKGILDIINLVNGKFRTPKISALHLLIDWVNNNNLKKTNDKNIVIYKLPIDNSPLESNSWLAGFSCCEGTFEVRTSDDGVRRNFSTVFSISQSRIDTHLFKAYEQIMSTIAKFLLAKLSIVYISTYDRLGKQASWRAKSTSQRGSTVVVNYFSKYPLFNSKQLDF
jgi:hypothetical protein